MHTFEIERFDVNPPKIQYFVHVILCFYAYQLSFLNDLLQRTLPYCCPYNAFRYLYDAIPNLCKVWSQAVGKVQAVYYSVENDYVYAELDVVFAQCYLWVL